MESSDKDNQDEAVKLKGKTGIARIFNAFGYSLSGLKLVFKHEAAFRQLFLLNVVLISVALALDVTAVERVLLIISVFLTLIIELFNSAIEAVVDRVSLSIHPLSKQAKDMGSAAQLLGLILVMITWLIILLS
ncbi:MAG: diacylglycerol kinase [Gammaproteobacteria bacterium]|nr:diacylglycerol kinase [Gammaproteobacteria bacterium]